MAGNALTDVRKVFKEHPDWTPLQAFNALKSKYSAEVLSQAVSTGYAEVDKANKAAQATKNKARTDAANKYYNSDEIAAMAAAGAGGDPTASRTATGVSLRPVVGGAGTGYTADSWMADFSQNGRLEYTPDTKTGKFYVTLRKEDGTKPMVFILGDPVNPGQYKVVDPTTALTETIQQYKSKPNGIKVLRQQIVASKRIPALTGSKAAAFINQGNSVDKTLSSYLAKALEDLTIDNFYAGPSKTFKDLGGFLTGAAGVGGGGVTTKTSVSSSIERSNADANAAELSAFVMEYLGRGATAKEISDYQAAIKSLENKRPTKTTSTVTGDATSIALGMAKKSTRVTEVGGITTEERLAMQVAVVSKALKDSGVDPATISKSGGKVSQIMDVLKQNAIAYGIQYDDKMALDDAIASIQPGSDAKASVEKMKQIAKIKYKNLASAIDGGATVADVAKEFQLYKNKVLELADPLDVFNPDIQRALNNDGKAGIMNLTDFNVYLRNKPEWAKTQNAREEAADYATTILKSFGFMG